MKDNELRGIVLQYFYDKREILDIKPDPADLEIEITSSKLYDICDQLGQHNLIKWREYLTLTGRIPLGGKITAHGIDVIEGNCKPNIAVKIMQSNTTNHNINISGSQNVAIGDNNNQNIIDALKCLASAIDASDAKPEAKEEAKGLLEKLLNNPIIASIAGAAITGLLS